MLLVAVLVVAAGVAVAVTPTRTGGRAGRERGSWRRVLDERRSRGEISEEEHARRTAVLQEGPPPSRPAWRLAAGAVVVVAGLLVAATWAGAGSGWSMLDRPMTGHMGWTTPGDAGDADAVSPDAQTLEVVATEFGFEPTTLTAPAGVRVNFRLVNQGRALHDLTVPELGFVLAAEPGETVAGSTVAPSPGTYEFICSVPGHEAAGMRGRLVVTEPAA